MTSSAQKTKLSPRQKLEIVLEVVEKNKPISRVCRQAGISRSFFYKLRKQYLQAGESRKEKLRALRLKRKWVRRGKQLSRTQVKEILKVVLKNPEYGIPRILRQIYANRRKKIVSHGGIQTFLLKLNLNTKRKRKLFAKRVAKLSIAEVIDLVLLSLAKYETKKPLSPEERLKALRLIDDDVPVTQVCRIFRISGNNFYKWQERYNQSVPGKEYQAVTNRKPIIKRYWRQATDEQVEAVLKIVIEHPEYSTHRVCRALPKIAGKSILGNHGVQNVFRRLNLNTYEKRLAYVQAQAPAAPPLVGLPETIKRLIGKIPVISAIPPPLRYAQSKLLRFVQEKQILLTSFIFSFLTSVVFSTIFIYWLRMISQAPTLGAKLGLLSATVALLVGSIFFAYSMKYYLTLAIVLSFSRQPLEEGTSTPLSVKGGFAVGLNGRLNNNQRNNNGWLTRIFGLGNGGRESRESGEGREVLPAGGLQPSLEHIKLKRYPFVSIHLPFYNEKKVAERILKACTSIEYPNFEIVVCDDSTDETTAIVERFAEEWNGTNRTDKTNRRVRPLIKVLHRPTRQGFKGGALGHALKHIDPRAEFVVVFDADFIPYPDTLELFVKYFKANNNNSENYSKSKTACVAGYQWHVLNKSENWITRGVRTEYAGSYVIERPGQEILGAMKLIHGSVYAIRADVLKKFGWGTSITEDFELTLKLYEAGYKVIYTPYVQAPAECASTLKRLIRQRMRWAEGHSHCVKRRFSQIMTSPLMTLTEKLEFLYLTPYYLQAFFFLVGTFSWLLAETVFRARLPFWTSLWGWSLVLTNLLSLPLVNAVGLFLEEAEEKDYLGIFSFVFLSYLLVPFQAYASVKGFLEKEEGPWFRTPKTGLITDIFTRGRFYRWISGILPGRIAPAMRIVTNEKARMHANSISINSQNLNSPTNSYLALATANNRFDSFKIEKKRISWVGKIALVSVLTLSILVNSMAFTAKPAEATWYSDANYLYRKVLTIDNILVSGSANHSNFPILVSYTDASLKTTANGGRVTNSNGYDIIFTDDDKTTKLDHEIEKYTPTTGEIVMWVRIPTLPYNADKDIYIYYGNSSISSSQENVNGVWNVNYKGVWHLKEDPAVAGSGGIIDSTSNANHGTDTGSMDANDQVPGKVDGSLDFDGSNDYISIKNGVLIANNTNVTISAWVQFNSAASGLEKSIYDESDSGGTVFRIRKDSSDRFQFDFMIGSNWYNTNNTTVSSAGNWYYVVGTLSSVDGMKIYVDGIEKGTNANTAPGNKSIVNSWIGRYGQAGYYFRGLIDEVRISDNPRSADWIQTAYNNHNNPGTGTGKFIKTLESEEQVPEMIVLLLPLAILIPYVVKYVVERRRRYLVIRG